MGKFTPNPQKLATVHQYFRSSRVAHSIKDLEKHLPAVASINGMQVKDYLQALSDDSKLHVEKIGSGNWYWAFASEDSRQQQNLLSETRSAHDKLASTVQDLRTKLQLTQALHNEDQEADAAAEAGQGRQELMERKAELEKEVQGLEREVAGYKDFDPVELERKRKVAEDHRAEAERFSDEILAMEGWFRSMGQDEEGLGTLREMFYGDQLDPEEGALREL